MNTNNKPTHIPTDTEPDQNPHQGVVTKSLLTDHHNHILLLDWTSYIICCHIKVEEIHHFDFCDTFVHRTKARALYTHSKNTKDINVIFNKSSQQDKLPN